MSDLPTVLFNEDGHPSLVSVTVAATQREAVRVAFEHAYDGAVNDYLGTADVNDDGSVYRPVLSEYRLFVNGLERRWHCPSPGRNEWEGGDIWNRCKGVGLSGAVEFWEIPE